MRYFFLLLLIAASIGVFFAFVIPEYQQTEIMRANVASYNANLAITNQLQQSRQALVAQYNNISKTDLDNIMTLLPDSVDNIRLIIQLDSLATKNNLSSLRAVEYNPDQLPAVGTASAATAPAVITDPSTSLLPYGQFVISFETTGQYSDFLAFLSDMEKNLRLVDITSVNFASVDPTATGAANVASGLTYKVTLTTYWLKQ